MSSLASPEADGPGTDPAQPAQVRPPLAAAGRRRTAVRRTGLPRRPSRGHRRRRRCQRARDLPALPQQGSPAGGASGGDQHPFAGRRASRRGRQRRTPGAALDGLVEFHLDFTLGEPDLIRIQDRDLSQLPAAALRQVRRSQRQYVEIWVRVLRDLNAGLDESDARLMAHAAFGLLNSTPYSTKPAGGKPAGSRSRSVLRAMTIAALTSATGLARHGWFRARTRLFDRRPAGRPRPVSRAPRR